MRLAKITAALLLSVIYAVAAHATPSTLIWIPSTDIQADKTWHLGIDNYFSPNAGTRSATDVGRPAPSPRPTRMPRPSWWLEK